MTTTYGGYTDGDRVRDTRDGSTGTVHVIELDPEDAADAGYTTTAEVQWDDSFVAFELDESLIPHLTPCDEPSDAVAARLSVASLFGPRIRDQHLPSDTDGNGGSARAESPCAATDDHDCDGM